MHRLILLSRCRSSIDFLEFDRLYKLWKSDSQAMGISGALLACDPYFLQMLEGPVSATSQLHELINNEPRHAEVHVIRDEPAMSRLFDRWYMTAMHMRGAHVDFQMTRTLLQMFRESVAAKKDLSYAARALVREFERSIVRGYEPARDVELVPENGDINRAA